MFVIITAPSKTLMENVVTICGLGCSIKAVTSFFVCVCTAVSSVCVAQVSEMKHAYKSS